MNTRSKSKLAQQQGTSARSEPGAPRAGGLGRSPYSDPVSADTTFKPAGAPGSEPAPVSPALHEQSNVSLSSRSYKSGSTQSTATVKARRLAAKAQLARRSMEREQKLFEREQQLAREQAERECEQKIAQQRFDFERKLVRLEGQVDEFETEASLAAQEAVEGSNRSVSQTLSLLRTTSWVNEHSVEHLPDRVTVDTNHHDILLNNLGPEQHILKPESHKAYLPKPVTSEIPMTRNDVSNDVLSYNRPAVHPTNKEFLVSQPKFESNVNNGSPFKFSSKYIELMPFSGKPVEWLMFKRTYEDTQHLFAPSENLARLRCALRGRAFESVSALLYTAARPEPVLHMLERTFAQPETIVLNEILQVRSLPKISYDQRDLNTFSCKVRNCIGVIKSLEQNEYLHSIEIFHSILSKLTPILYSQWKDFAYRSDRQIPKLLLLSEFLDIEADKHNKFGLIVDHSKRPAYHAFSGNYSRRETFNVTSTRTGTTDSCRFCKNKHKLSECVEFKSLSLDDKWRWLREAKICYKCLNSKMHRWNTCKINRCGVDGCERFHNPLLHAEPTAQAAHTYDDAPATSLPSRSIVSDPTENNKSVTVSNTTESFLHSKNSAGNAHVFLKIIPVEVSGPNGKYNTFALLDDGSTATLIDSEVARHIGAVGPRDSIKVEGVAGMSTSKPIQHVSFTIKGRKCSEVHSVTNAKAMDNLSLFTQTIKRNDLLQFPHLDGLVDELTLIDATPKILLGAEHWFLTVSREVREGSKNQPVACRTALGWVLHGKSSSWTKPVHFVNHAVLTDSSDSSLDGLIKEYFRLESIGISKQETSYSKLDECALETLDSTTMRLPSGRFQIGLLWKKEIPNIPDSYPQAFSRFLGLERRMARDSDFKKAYCDFINSMVQKGYAEECPRDTYRDTIDLTSQGSIRWYLPHFPVVHPQKKKLRVVHDAAAQTLGVSLNSLLLPGPDLLQSLLHILYRFREGRVALTADVREMFPQIKIREQDRDALRYIWREDHNSELKEYRMTSVIFGAVCSPCTALYIKNRNAQELQKSYPAAAHAVINDHYMDDYLGSLDDVQEAAQLAADIVTVHNHAGMEMRSWVSNVPAALEKVPVDLRAAPLENVSVGPEAFVRTLGLIWHPQSDTFSFRLGSQFPENEKLTKRKVLSHLMCVYDPIGLLTPLVIQGRILFQQTWRTGIDWDTELQEDAIRKWLSWSQHLTSISDIKVPRWYRCGFQDRDISNRQLHVFADASEQAYSCAAYWRFVFSDGSVKLSLVGGKARLAPLKPTSIPRLELQAALIAARYANTVCTGHKVHVNEVYLWSDSTTVLSWVRSDARTFKPFVPNRVGEITEITNVNCWRYVPSGLNVADDATRLKDTIDLRRWLSGPDFLLQASADWPKEPTTSNTSVSEEAKQSKALVLTTVLEPLPVTPDPSRFSDWTRLVRATARVYQCAKKFRSNILAQFKRPNPKLTDHSKIPLLTVSEIQKAEIAIFKASQIDSFSQELALIHDSKPLTKISRLHSLSLKLDEDGLLRLDSRIKHMRGVDYETISPIILDGRHPAVRLLIRYYHVKAAHAFNELVCNELKQRYWILRCRTEVRSIARQCMFCAKRRATPKIPPEGNLPDVRLGHHIRPFTNVGLDYFGPIEISVGRRREKRWVALFTCLSTRAVHLEIVGNLSSDSAISCLRRFIARRGIPQRILSDNGTSFVGANRQLKEFYDEAVQDFAVSNQCEWSFIPPASPFMGGSWERLVRTVKTALLATLHERAPKEELLHTLLLEAEALINSRPLTYVAQNDECQSLTPFHFLLGTSSNSQIPAQLDDKVFCLRKEWKKVLRLSEHFWNRWLKEYLPSLRARRQQGSGYSNLKVNDMVLVVDPGMPRGAWPMGRITAVHPGRDGVVRVADVACKGGTLRRPVRKLALLNDNILL